jgi:pimeloyl-ACP methyl ester carboxylesterase
MIYFISGLGADERVFKYLNLGNYRYKHIKWEKPTSRESLLDYCGRLLKQIDLSEEIILIGVSFGGIVAQEISRIINVRKVIILSSVKSKEEFSWQLSTVSKFQLYKLVPSGILKWSNKLTGEYYFGVNSAIESELLKQILNDTDSMFLKWAIDAIMKWDGNSTDSNLVHLQGDKDRIFPVTRMKNFIRIVGGGHFMVVNRAEEISEIIKSEIKDIAQ